MSITSAITTLGRPVAFYPAIARAFGDINTALIVCQFMYWRGRVGDREIYKTQAEIEQETFVPAHTQRRVLKRLSDLGMVTVEKKGIPARNHFEWHWDVVDTFVSDYILQSQQGVTTSANKLSPLDMADCHDKTEQTVTTNTETTAETTAESLTAAQQAPAASKRKKSKAFGLADLLANNPHGIAEQVLSDWLQSRKASRASVSETVWLGILRELAKCADAGISPESALIEAVMAGWRGFKFEWIKNRLSANNTRHAATNSYDCPKCGSHMDDCVCWAETINEGPF